MVDMSSQAVTDRVRESCARSFMARKAVTARLRAASTLREVCLRLGGRPPRLNTAQIARPSRNGGRGEGGPPPIAAHSD